MSFVKGSVIYVGSNILNAVIPFILLPILTRTLTQAEYGAVTMFQMLGVGLGTIVGLSVHGAANRKYYDQASAEELREYNGVCLHILLTTFVLCLAIIGLWAEPMGRWLNLPVSWLYMALAISTCGFVVQIRLGQWQVRGQPIAYATLQLGQAMVNLVVSLLLVTQLHRAGQGRVEAIFVASLVGATLALISLWRDQLVNFLSFNKAYVHDALSYGLPLIPHVLGFFLLSNVDRLIIGHYLGMDAVGVYGVAFQISLGLSILFDGINKAFVPWLFAILTSNDEQKKRVVVKKTYLWFSLLLLAAGLSFVIGPWFVIHYAGAKYQESAQLIGWVCTGQIFGGMYLMVTNYIFYAKKTAYLALVTLLSGCINVALAIVLIQYYQLAGLVGAFFISKLFQFVLTWALAARVHAMPWLLMR